jgi:hypothetical protein
MQAPPHDLPTVAFALGHSTEDLLRASTFDFALTEVHAIDLVPVTRAVRFVCLRSPGGFEVPVAGLVNISFLGARINSARINPHLGGLDEAEATALASDMLERIEAAGYQRVSGLGRSVKAVPFDLADRERPVDTTLLLGKWMHADDAVLLELERSASSNLDHAVSAPSHVVRLRLENGPLTRRQSALVTGAGRDVVWRRVS